MTSRDPTGRRREVLESLGGTPEAIEEVLEYGRNRFDLGELPAGALLPRPDEPHLEAWRRYRAEADEVDSFAYLAERIVQLSIPIAEGTSASAAYRDVVRRGHPFEEAAFGGRLTLDRPERFRFFLHEHPAGALPVLFSDHRPDFVRIVQALSYRCEPYPLNDSVSAHLVSGLINWDRVSSYRAAWLESQPVENMGRGWAAEMTRVAKEESWRFHDRVMIMDGSPYAGLSAKEIGVDLTEGSWLARSLVWRIEHEFTHYLTHRLFGYSSLNLLDETICDFVGCTAAQGRFDHLCFLRAMGLDRWPTILGRGRVHAYRQDLGDEAFRLECAVLIDAVRNLDALAPRTMTEPERTRFALALTRLTLEQLAGPSYETEFAAAEETIAEVLAARGADGASPLGSVE